MRALLRSLPITVFALAATAEAESAATCESQLSAPAREIYSATLAQKPTKDTAREIIVAQVEAMIRDGKLSPVDGRAAGEAAGKCLELLE
ncbi:MAG: hypothetical protein KDA73_07970 [Rhodobacteraceae bacterium]|nr:hypothetical protein [Paracoccaceae bacterium]